MAGCGRCRARLALARRPEQQFCSSDDEQVDAAAREACGAASDLAARACRRRRAHEGQPSQALRSGRRRSHVACDDTVKKKEADMVVSTSNTSALMAISSSSQDAAGIDRRDHGAVADAPRQSIVLDGGASIGRIRAPRRSRVMEPPLRDSARLKRPTIQLLNIGVEEVKDERKCVKPAGYLRERPCRSRLCRLSRRR